MIRIVLSDDHNLVRAGLRALLEDLPDVEIVAEAADGQAALAAIANHRPEVAFIDIGMPGLNGLEVAVRAAREAPATRIVLISMHSNESYVAQALTAGVAGYVLKDAYAAALPMVPLAALPVETYLIPAISRKVVDALRARMSPSENAPPVDPLTSRQREILQLLAEGKSTKEIAHLLNLSVKTVETHRAQI